MDYVWAIVSLAGLGALFGVALGWAARVFAVKRDPRTDEILNVLPGANCGACGFAGCGNYAAEVAAGRAAVGKCPVGGTRVAREVAQIMGVSGDVSVARRTARVRCGGSRSVAADRFRYIGIADCKAAELAGGGPKACRFGCLGLGTCASVCQFEAIRMGDDGLPVVDLARCTACGRCVAACPRHLIELVPEDNKVVVACCSTARGAEVRKVCKAGCIGCNACVKVCPRQAITVENNLARIAYDRCDNCGKCAEKCPTGCILVGGRRVVEEKAAAGGAVAGAAGT